MLGGTSQVWALKCRSVYMSQNKVFKKGEVIFKEGDKSISLYLIQSGSVQVYLQRPKQKIELYKLGKMQILAEQVLSGSQVYSASAMAMNETTLMEFNAESVKTQITALNQVMKLILKSTMDKLKLVSAELRSSKLATDSTPCPQDQIAKVFGSLFHAVNYKGEKKDEKNPKHVVVSWTTLKQYAQRIFGESPKRLESTVNLFVKMKLASYEMVKNSEAPEEPEQIGNVHFTDVAAIENFFEFFQYYYYKGGKLDLFKVHETSARIVTHLLELVKEIAADRKGMVSIPFDTVIEKFKSLYHINLNTDHFAVLEQKGLFANRQSHDKGVILSFDIREWQIMLMNWRILKEIEKWNEKGFVDATEAEESFIKKLAVAMGPQCPECETAFVEGAKFCSNCGHKIGEKAA